MKKTLFTLHLFVPTTLLCLFACQSKDPCGVEPDKAYQFPSIPANSSMTIAEREAYVNLPANISQCLTTRSLIETCLAYPNISLIDAGVNPQSGYRLVSTKFRGLNDLSNREDRSVHLLDKYRSVVVSGYPTTAGLAAIGNYTAKIYYLEVIISQEINLKSFNLEQKISLVEQARAVYEQKRTDANYGLYRIASSDTLLSRLMKADRYQPFLAVYKPNEPDWDVVAFYWPATPLTVQAIYELSTGYLTFLKRQR
ncbi:hypothetical protein J2I47_07380 [Fibrella sp. HMF5335]|uniref:Uncharacterized protein n=1 Tax=Fibrella rubiginis TaxID=2817060 RepID=A0A939GGJ8_9BACT|nr:hypothetical protein [Fibrella rubiginis]MBO0936366.1 hypothetical protein [Fibrella rubiginis]